MAAQLEKVKDRTLESVRNFFLDSLQYDREAEIGKGPQYVRYLQDLESRIKTEQDTRQSLEKKLRAELKKGGVTDEIAIELGGGRFGAQEKAEEGS